MTRRTVTVDGKEYGYKIGRLGIKVDGVGYNKRPLDYDGRPIQAEYTPADIVAMIRCGMSQEPKRFPNKDTRKR